MARNMVEGTNGIDREDCGAWVQGCRSVEELVEALGAGPRAEPELAGEARVLEGIRKVLRKNSGHKPPEDVADDKGPDPAIGLAQCNNTSEPDGRKHWLRNIRVGQSLCRLV